ncbi:MAG: hypothetical protein HY398_01215 [Candidatus Doudnabacteria bacterium]|nr:hypothetical protein [Candidatus Doudnabacteria bacterium]
MKNPIAALRGLARKVREFFYVYNKYDQDQCGKLILFFLGTGLAIGGILLRMSLSIVMINKLIMIFVVTASVVMALAFPKAKILKRFWMLFWKSYPDIVAWTRYIGDPKQFPRSDKEKEVISPAFNNELHRLARFLALTLRSAEAAVQCELDYEIMLRDHYRARLSTFGAIEQWRDTREKIENNIKIARDQRTEKEATADRDRQQLHAVWQLAEEIGILINWPTIVALHAFAEANPWGEPEPQQAIADEINPLKIAENAYQRAQT